jgi:methyl-accepting chemotaxis protein
LAVLLIATSIEIYFSFQIQQKVVASQLLQVAEDAADKVKSFVLGKFHALQGAVTIGDLMNINQEEQKLILEKLLGSDQAFRQITLLDAQNKKLAEVSRQSSLFSTQIGPPVSDIFSLTNKEKMYVSSVYINNVTSEPMVVIAVPITNTFGDSAGALIAEVNLKFMWDLVNSIKVGNKGLAYVVDNRGNLIAFGDISRVLSEENLMGIKEVNDFVNANNSTIENDAEVSKGIQGNDVMSAYFPLGAPDWAVVVELPVLEAYDNVIWEIYLSILMVIVTSTLVIVVSIFLSKKITTPIKKLTKNIEDISMGKLDTEVDQKLKDSKNEIGALARAFDRTLISLKLAMRQIKPSDEGKEDKK